jgi:hypothetical protein
VARFARLALIVTLLLMGLTFLTSLAVSLMLAITQGASLVAVVGFSMGMLASLLVAGWAVVAYGVVRVLVANEAHIDAAGSHLERLETLIGDQAQSLRQIHEQACLSDKAKRLLYRDHELDAFRESIQHALFRQDYDAAEQLIDEIEQDIGYAEEARRLRKEVTDYRSATMEEKAQAAVNRVEQLITKREWSRALRETRRLAGSFAEYPKVAELPRRIHLARTQHKRQLLQAYGEATRRNDVDRSIGLLKELDAYLTPQEAAALSESARGVFKARLNNLGVQFAIFVEDEQWEQAIASGEEIVREFPNSRMAQEVRSKMSTLQARASAVENSAPAK